MAFGQGMLIRSASSPSPTRPSSASASAVAGRGLERADHVPQAVFRSERQHHIVDDALVGEQLRNLERARNAAARNRARRQARDVLPSKMNAARLGRT